MAIEDDSISNTYGLNVDNPGASCNDMYEKNVESRGKSVIRTDKLSLIQCDIARVWERLDASCIPWFQ